MGPEPGRRAIPPDYDQDPERFRLARSVLRRHALAPDVHESVAQRLLAEGCTPVLDEAHRVLRPGGMVAVAAPSRDDSPELAEALPRVELTFDAELAPQMLAERFARVELERWDAPLLELPDRAAVRDYLTGKGVEPRRASEAAETTGTPLTVTKRGALAFGWRS